MNVMKIIVYPHKYETVFHIIYFSLILKFFNKYCNNIANLFIVKNQNQSKFKGIIVN